MLLSQTLFGWENRRLWGPKKWRDKSGFRCGLDYASTFGEHFAFFFFLFFFSSRLY